MRPTRLLALALTVACGGGSPSGPGSTPPGPEPPGALAALRLLPADTTLIDLDVDVELRVEAVDAAGRTLDVPAGVALESVAATPALAELPVLGRLDAARRRVAVRGPGTARVRARVGEVVSGESTLRVAPPEPIIAGLDGTGAVTSGSRVTLRGYRLDLVPEDALTYGGEAVEIVARSATGLTFLAPEHAFGACQGVAAADLVVEGVRVLEPIRLAYDRPAALELEVGEAASLGALRDGCLALPAAASGSYTLMLFDTRGVESARSKMEDAGLRLEEFRFAIRDRSGTLPAGAGSEIGVARTGSRITGAGIPVDEGAARGPLNTSEVCPPNMGNLGELPFCHETPWKVGDRTLVYPIPGYPQVGYGTPATVVRIYGEIFVLVVPDRDIETYHADERLSVIDDAMGDILDVALPLLGEAFSRSMPRTTEGSGQILIVLADQGNISHFGAASSPDRVPDDGGYVEISSAGWLEMGDQPIYVNNHVFAHELAHAWGSRYLDDVCLDTGVCGGPGADPWGSEGSASVIEQELHRALRGRPLNGNERWTTLWGNTPTFFGHTSGVWTFGAGYGSSWWYLQDLIARAVETGVPYERALAEVERGALEGWFGYSRNGRRRGLEARMRDLLGADFDALDDLLHAAVRLAADDLTTDPGLQLGWVENGWEMLPEIATIHPGTGAEIDDEAFGTGFGYVRIEDGGIGGSYAFQAGVDGVHWMVVRTR